MEAVNEEVNIPDVKTKSGRKSKRPKRYKFWSITARIMLALGAYVGIASAIPRFSGDYPVHLVSDIPWDRTIIIVLVSLGGIPSPDIDQVRDPLIEIHVVRLLKRECHIDPPIAIHLDRHPVIIRQIEPDPIDLRVAERKRLRAL